MMSCWVNMSSVFLLLFLSVGHLTSAFLLEDSTPSVPLTGNLTNVNETENLNITVCYDNLGCFSNIPPFDNAANLLPLPPDEMNTAFILSTRTHPEGENLDYLSASQLSSTSFNRKDPIKIVTHGFTQNSSIYWMQNMKKAFLSKWSMNVILVDWGNGAAFPNYPLAVANARLVGTQIYKLIEVLVAAGVSLDNIHCIGHSLGAHAFGHAGMLLGGKLGRITAMDAAGPEYEEVDLRVRLDPSDALFVDAIHTNDAPIYLGGLSLREPVGHIDFYVNGGETQPGCPSITSALGTLLQNIDGHEGRLAISCSHSRSHELFVESITTTCPFTAYPCPSEKDFEGGKCWDCRGKGCPRLGYFSSESSARGKMFINTLSKAPYCGYNYFVQLNTNGTETKGKVMIRLSGSKDESPWMKATPHDDEHLNSDKAVTRSVVSDVDVGDIRLIYIRYIKSDGFWFLGGKDTWEWNSVEIKPSSSSNRYFACTEGRPLKNGEENEYLAVSSCH